MDRCDCLLDMFVKYWFQWVLGLIAMGLAAGFRYTIKRIKAIDTGTRALLKDRIIQAYMYHMEKGFWPLMSQEATLSMYHEYKRLGGNGTVDGLVDALKKLPTKIEDC